MNINQPVFCQSEHQKWTRVEFGNILYVEGNSEASVFVFKDGKKVKLKNSLLKINAILPLGFERINRYCIVNMNHVNSFDLSEKSLVLADEINLKFGLRYKENVQKYFL